MEKSWYEKLLEAIFGMFDTEKKTIAKTEIVYLPKYKDTHPAIKIIQKALVFRGFPLKIDGKYGPRTKIAISDFQKSKGMAGSGIIGPRTLKLLNIVIKKPKLVKGSKAPWFWNLKNHEGKVESNSEFNQEMSSGWKLVGLPGFKTIVGSKRAWCGLFIAVGLSATGYHYQKTGARAKDWDKFGNKIEWRVNGFPQGAIIRINHKLNCEISSSNHVTMANGDCSAKDLLKSGASFSGYGGNQGNTAKVSQYPVAKICSVSWPKEVALPGIVNQSKNCSNGKTDSSESTR